MKKQLVDFYTSKAGTHNYIIGFHVGEHVFIAKIENPDFMELTRVSRMSSKRGGWATLRLQPGAVKTALLGKAEEIELGYTGLVALGRNHEYTGSKQNNIGTALERYITEADGQEWKKDSVSFTEQGDVVIDGIDYQIKWENATLTSERAMARA